MESEPAHAYMLECSYIVLVFVTVMVMVMYLYSAFSMWIYSNALCFVTVIACKDH